MDTFGSKLAFYRKRAHLSQEELGPIGNLHPSDLSKIERDIRKPPKPENIMPMIKTLGLSAFETTELLTLGNYSPSVFGKVEFDPTFYPDMTEAMAEAWLQGEKGYWPVWRLDEEGNIIALNLLAMWLWGGLTTDGDIDASKRFLGVSVFDVYVRPENFDRILMPRRKTDFWYTKLAVFRKLEDHLSPMTVEAFKKKIYENDVLHLIYEGGAVNLEKEWFYHLSILPPALRFASLHENTSIEFEVSVVQIKEHDKHIGYIVTFQPLKYAIEITEEAYNELIEKHGRKSFVYTQNTQGEEERRYPSFFPTLYHDLLWYILDENRAQQLLAGDLSFKGKHFFDLILSTDIEKIAGTPHEATAMKALWYFIKLLAPYEDPSHPMHQQYMQMRRELDAKPRFHDLAKWLWNQVSLKQLGEMPQEGVPASYHKITCRYSRKFDLELESFPRFPRPHLPNYRVTLVPKNDETKAALILMLLEDSIATSQTIDSTPVAQLAWGIAIIRTVREGITKGEGDEDWGIEEAFHRIHQELEENFSHVAKPIEELTFQLHMAALSLLVHFSYPSTEYMADMLLNFMKFLTPYAYIVLAKKYGEATIEIPQKLRDDALSPSLPEPGSFSEPSEQAERI